jgi:hypothetical protein
MIFTYLSNTTITKVLLITKDILNYNYLVYIKDLVFKQELN